MTIVEHLDPINAATPSKDRRLRPTAGEIALDEDESGTTVPHQLTSNEGALPMRFSKILTTGVTMAMIGGMALVMSASAGAEPGMGHDHMGKATLTAP